MYITGRLSPAEKSNVLLAWLLLTVVLGARGLLRLRRPWCRRASATTSTKCRLAAKGVPRTLPELRSGPLPQREPAFNC